MAEKLGIYIHIPFCRSKCDYCDFYSLAGREGAMDAYCKALSRHITETAPLAKAYEVDTVYFGGGTPTLLGDKRLRELLGLVKKKYRVTSDGEITMEANPDSVDRKTLTRLRRAGVNRLSLGMQSACEWELSAVHRPHTAQQTRQAVEWARSAKIKNISLDLIYGLPGQTEESWRETLKTAIDLAPQHLSCYGLKVEPGTPLCQRVERGEQLPGDDQQAHHYLEAIDALGRAGYRQYEISNFAQTGFRSRHNLKYWLGKPYIGFGPGAHSDFGARRYSFLRDLDAYMAGVVSGGVVIDEEELIPQRERAGEYLMLRLRTTHGIEEWEYRREYFMNFEPIAQKLALYERQGWAQQKERRWSFTPEGFLRSNLLIGELLEAQEGATLSATLKHIKKLEEKR